MSHHSQFILMNGQWGCVCVCAGATYDVAIIVPWSLELPRFSSLNLNVCICSMLQKHNGVKVYQIIKVNVDTDHSFFRVDENLTGAEKRQEDSN